MTFSGQRGYTKVAIVLPGVSPYFDREHPHLIEGDWDWGSLKNELPHRTLCGIEFPDMIRGRRAYAVCPDCMRVRRRLDRAKNILLYGPKKDQGKRELRESALEILTEARVFISNQWTWDLVTGTTETEIALGT